MGSVNCFMNGYTWYKANNHNFISYTKKWNGNIINVSEMEDTWLQGGIDIDAVLSTSTLHQYSSMVCNNESHPPLVNSKIASSNHSSVSTFTSPSDNSRNDEVCSLQNTIHEKMDYSDFSKLNK